MLINVLFFKIYICDGPYPFRTFYPELYTPGSIFIYLICNEIQWTCTKQENVYIYLFLTNLHSLHI